MGSWSDTFCKSGSRLPTRSHSTHRKSPQVQSAHPVCATMAESGIPGLVPASAEAMLSTVGLAHIAERLMAPASQEQDHGTQIHQTSARSLISVLLGPTVTPANPRMCVVQRSLAQHAAHSAAVANANSMAGVVLARPSDSVIKICDPQWLQKRAHAQMS